MLANPERLFEKSWRPRHPLRRRHCAARRRGMAAVLLFLAIIIFGYIYLTDAQRVRAMASAYLGDLLGGEVTIGNANLSIFEGLRLDDVTLRVDKSNQADSIIFHARTFLIRYHPTELLAGRLSATQIIAIDPVVLLVEDPQTHRWNYQRLWHGNGPPKHKQPNGGLGAMVLPQVILRDAEVAYMELRAGKTVPIGWYSIEGSLVPSDEEPDRYDFQLQSRGRESMGPSVNGILRTSGGISVAHMQNFSFGPDVNTMLLAEPRQWCEWHQLQGNINVPEMVYNPNPGGSGPIFRATLVLSDVEMAIHPEEWMTRAQNQRIQALHDYLDSPQAGRWLSPGTIQSLRKLSTPQPIRFTQVSGDIVFTEQGIELKGLSGKVESNWFNIDGMMLGYSPDAPAHLTISSVTGHDLDIPDISPDYLGTLPREAQDVIEHLHPRGTCAIRVDIQRDEPGGRPSIRGQVDVKDGEFCSSDFPYPVSRVQGQLLIGEDPITHVEGIRILNLVGHGSREGVNADATLTLNGFVGPLQGVAGVSLQAAGTDVAGDPQLRSALPPDAQRALQMFDPEGHGEYPKFHGSFSCHIFREPGPRKPWIVDTYLNLDNAEGKIAAFPYPLKMYTGRLDIHDGYLNIANVRMHRGDGEIAVDGIVRWKTSTSSSTQPSGPDLKIVGRNVPIDDDLKNALPPMQRTWVQNGGLTGVLDLDGHVYPKPGSENLTYQFDGALRNGKIQSDGAEAAMSGMTAKLHLTPTSLEIADLRGERGPSALTAQAQVDWSGDRPKILLSAAAKNLQLNQSLYQMLPQSAKDGWDSVSPRGVVDATLELADQIGLAPERLELHIIPRTLSVTPAPLPYRLDNLQGDIYASPNEVVLHNMKATHGNAQITLDGKGEFGPQQAWDMKIGAENLTVDDEFLNALPNSMATVLRGLKVNGTIGLDLSKLNYWPNGQPSTTQPAQPGADIDFAANIKMEGANVEVGLPATNMHGNLDLAGLIRGGNLHRLAGQCTVDTMQLAGKPASDFSFTIQKNSDDPEIDVAHAQGRFADGDIAGQGDYTFPDNADSKYDVNLVLRDADVQQLTSGPAADIKGRLTASLQLGGSWDDPSSRRGHGDVTVSGDKLYNIPVMLGLMQITNLQLPLSSPFKQIQTRYTLEGERVTFETIELKSNDVTMTGKGYLDFAAGQVSLWLATTNPALIALPVIGPLLGGANEELLRIHIKGTIDRPKISASTFDTVTTTVDQVFKGNDQEH
jgi:hypothetical protein